MFSWTDNNVYCWFQYIVFLTKVSSKASASLNFDYLSQNYVVLSKGVAKAAYLLHIGW